MRESALERVLASNALVLYPNPTDDRLVVQLATGVDGGDLQIMDLQGKLLLTQRMSGTGAELNIDEFSNGLYYLRLVHGQESLIGSFAVLH